MSELKRGEINAYTKLSPIEELRQQIKDWLAKDHKLTQDNIEAISLLWSAYDHLKTESPDIGNPATENHHIADVSEMINTPLSLEELRGMDGEPVWFDHWGCWVIVSVEDFKGRKQIRLIDKCGATFAGYVKEFYIYRQKPETKEEAECSK